MVFHCGPLRGCTSLARSRLPLYLPSHRSWSRYRTTRQNDAPAVCQHAHIGTYAFALAIPLRARLTRLGVHVILHREIECQRVATPELRRLPLAAPTPLSTPRRGESAYHHLLGKYWSMEQIRKATLFDNDRIAATYASAFEDDPTFSWFFPNANTRRRRLQGFFRFVGPHMALPHDETWMTDDALAVAIWIPPDKWKMPMMQQLRLLPGFVRWSGRFTPRILSALTKMDKVHPHDPPSWYLLGLGTVKEHQGKGLGSAVLSHMLARCDTEGLPAYLESSNPRNIPFYARHGFVEREPIRFGDQGPVLTPMWRDPR